MHVWACFRKLLSSCYHPVSPLPSTQNPVWNPECCVILIPEHSNIREDLHAWWQLQTLSHTFGTIYMHGWLYTSLTCDDDLIRACCLWPTTWCACIKTYFVWLQNEWIYAAWFLIHPCTLLSSRDLCDLEIQELEAVPTWAHQGHYRPWGFLKSIYLIGWNV